WAVISPLASRWPPVTSALPMHSSDFLSTVPLFKSLGPPELERFAEAVREKSYPKGSVILFEDDGREVILGILGVGDHFGELSLIDDQPRSAHVIAMEDSVLLVLRREDF